MSQIRIPFAWILYFLLQLLQWNQSSTFIIIQKVQQHSHLQVQHDNKYILRNSRQRSEARNQRLLMIVSSSSNLNPESQVNSTRMAAILEAQELRKRAQALLEEARREEILLRSQKELKQKESNDKLDSHIDSLLIAAAASDDALDKNRSQYSEEEDPIIAMISNATISNDQWLQIVERLFERESIARGIPSTSTFQIGASRNNMEDPDRLSNLMERILHAHKVLDEQRVQRRNEPINGTADLRKKSNRELAPLLISRRDELMRRLGEDTERQINARMMKRNDKEQQTTVEDYMRETLLTSSTNRTNPSIQRNTKNMNDFMFLPEWVPSSIENYIVNSREDLSKEDARQIRYDVLKNSLFYCSSSSNIRAAAIYRGNFLTSSSSYRRSEEDISGLNGTLLSQVVFDDVQKRLRQAEGGLSDRVQLFLLNEPEGRLRGSSPSENDRPRPVILAVPASVTPATQQEPNIILLTTLTVLLSFRYSVAAYALNIKTFNAVLIEGDLSILVRSLPIAFGILLLQVVHEIAHKITAKKYNVKLGLPVPIPSLQLGCGGAITPLRSFPSSRTHLIDIAASGPVTVLILSLICIVVGIVLTTQSPVVALDMMPVVSVAILRTSFLVGLLSSFIAPKLMLLPISQPIPLHPLVLIGYSGLFASALNLLPIGRLDGGRMFMAAFGRPKAKKMSFLLAALFWGALFFSVGPDFLRFWGLLVVLFQNTNEIQLRDEVTAIDERRLKGYVGLLFLVATILAPFPGALGAS